MASAIMGRQKLKALQDRFHHLRCAPGLDKEAIEARYTRLSGAQEFEPKQGDLRLPAERDRDRILYAPSFKRLGEITQVIPRERGHIVHNRLTHTLKVAQLGRRLAERLLSGANELAPKDAIDLANRLGGLDPNVVEAAALAHDLGHPPFGHIIEEYLDKTIKDETLDGYEGNAQTFRIISFLENRDIAADKSCGLDLTLATLNATQKYPWARDIGAAARGLRSSKFGYYAHSSPDKEHFEKIRKTLSASCGGDGLRSLEAELMDWADDIAYAVYDIDDFFRAGLIPLDKILRECLDFGSKAHLETDNELHFLYSETRQRWDLQHRGDDEIAKLDDYFQVFIEFFREISISSKALSTKIGEDQGAFKDHLISLRSTYRATDEQRKALIKLTSSLVEEFAAAISLNPDSVTDRSKPKVLIKSQSKTVVKMLKEMTWTYVIDSPDLHAVQEGQRQIVEMVFGKLQGDRKDTLKLIPKSIREMFNFADGPGRRRNICDIIAGMTETQIADLYARFTGISPGSLLRASYTT